jgi:hypothetical protein
MNWSSNLDISSSIPKSTSVCSWRSKDTTYSLTVVSVQSIATFQRTLMISISLGAQRTTTSTSPAFELVEFHLVSVATLYLGYLFSSGAGRGITVGVVGSETLSTSMVGG